MIGLYGKSLKLYYDQYLKRQAKRIVNTNQGVLFLTLGSNRSRNKSLLPFLHFFMTYLHTKTNTPSHNLILLNLCIYCGCQTSLIKTIQPDEIRFMPPTSVLKFLYSNIRI